MSGTSWAEPAALGTQVAVFNSFAILGILLLTLIVATAHFSAKVHRNELWFRHLIAWIIYDVAFILLLGRQEDAVLPFGLCVFQASLIYAVPTYATLSAFSFVADLYIRLSSIVLGKRKIRPALNKFLVNMPFFVLLGVFTEALVLVQDPSAVGFEQRHLYCHVTTTTQSLISGGIIVATGLVIFPLEICIAIMMYRNWRPFRGYSGHRIFLTTFIRVVLFTIISMLGVGLSSLSIGSPTAPKPYWARLIFTIIPVVAAITFGSQEDIMRSWIFWREPPPADDEDDDVCHGIESGPTF
ncbi:hypothetical protein FB45DRAFT_1054078 [Roridomyces roridus]|uniref:Uncharacterized protein n=1 Tax=Roridomyces roridus TaxID=1738132 RepID=A0AAD7FT80_9AGAR|nr:hypothetical protein FB45DRAFT_1054078 [Roridomyces roridus]